MQACKDDLEFTDEIIEKVEKNNDGSFSIFYNGLSLYCGKAAPIEPQAGMTARMYRSGVFGAVRGLFIDGHCFWYRTPAEEDEHREIILYGANASDWLKRWDGGQSVWSIEMGGLGPGYEQAIQVTATEVLRHLLDAKYDAMSWDDTENRKRDRKQIDKFSFANKHIKTLGLSGAQYIAALNLACQIYMRGPRAVFGDERVKDRKILVMRDFPGSGAI